jgi:hypothetical protein
VSVILSVPSLAQESVGKRLEFSVLAKTDFYKWREYSENGKQLLVQDLGNLWGGGIRSSYHLSKHFTIYLDGEYSQGNITYKGSIISNGQQKPYTQTNAYCGWNASVKIEYTLVLSSQASLQPYAGVATYQWTRDLIKYGQFTSLLTYNELYFLLSPQVGLNGKFALDKEWTLLLSFSMSYPIVSTERLFFNDPAAITAAYQQASVQNPALQPAADFDWTNVRVKHGVQMNPQVEAVLRYKKYGSFIRYQQFNLGRSTDGGTVGISIHQPNSQNDILTVGLMYTLTN